MAASRHYAFKVALVGAILGLLFYFVPVAEVGAALAGVAPGYLAIGVLLQFLMRAVSTPRMRVITANQGMDLSHGQLFRILLITQYYTLLLPGTLAAGGATWLKYVQAGANRSAAVASVMLNRGIGTLVMMVTGAIAWSLTRDPAQSGLAPILVVLCSALLLVAVFGHLPFLSTREIALSGPRWLQWLGGLINRLLQFQRVSPGGKLVVLASSLAHELVGALTIWCFARAVGLSLDLLTVVWMRAALQVVLMAPLHIAGLGLREASLVGLGALVGVAPPVAVAWSLVIFAGSLIVSAVGGLLEANSVAGYFARPKSVPLVKARRESGS
jgi:glycosyltransferase 2 family protein